jgi:hypothetical protein
MLAIALKRKFKKVEQMLANPIACQQKIFQDLLFDAKDTQFGKDHFFNSIQNYESFKQKVPLRNYEDLLPYIEKIKAGETNILWKGRPAFFGKTSGTTSKIKFIPVTKHSLNNQIGAPQYAAVNYANRYNKYAFLKGKMLLFSDGHFFEEVNGIKAAPISTIANSCVPSVYKWMRLPSDKINAIPEYEKRIAAMIEASVDGYVSSKSNGRFICSLICCRNGS